MLNSSTAAPVDSCHSSRPRAKNKTLLPILVSYLLIVVGVSAWTERCKCQIVNAALSGTVFDSTGAAIPGSTVRVTDVLKGITATTFSDASGNYTFPDLVPDPYRVTFEKRGFATTVLNGIVLQVNQKAILDATLNVGSVSQQVQVTAPVPIVSTETATIGTVIGGQQAVELPLNLRRFSALAALVPGAVPDNGGFASGVLGTPFSEQTFNSNGNRPWRWLSTPRCNRDLCKSLW